VNCLVKEAEGTLVQADPASSAGLGLVVRVDPLGMVEAGSPAGLDQVVQANLLGIAAAGNPAGLDQVVQAESLEFADRARLAALRASRVRDIETPTGCTCRSLRSGPRLRETDAA